MKSLNRAPYSRTHIFLFLAAFLLLFAFNIEFSVAGSQNQVKAFVTRFYQECLGRNPDAAGLTGWVNYLICGSKTGSDVANGFIFSPEYLGMNTTDQQYVTTLYKAFFNRTPDAPGYNRWLNELSDETPIIGAKAARKNILNGFLGSPEFKNLCTLYGITPIQTNTSTSTAPEIVLKGSINRTTNYFGDIKLLGELQNIGNKTASYVKIKFNFYDTNSMLIGTDSTYVYGSCLTLSSSDYETDTCLKQNEIGAFEVYTSIDNDTVSKYTYTFSFQDRNTKTPDANMIVLSSITEQEDYSHDLQLLGIVKNTGKQGLVFGEIKFAIKNSSGKIIDTDSTYIDGDNVLLSSINSYTETALRPGSTGTFDTNSDAAFDEYSSYYYKTSWRDRKIENNIAYSRLRSSSSLNEIVDLQLQTEEERQDYRNRRIEEQRKRVELLLN